MAVKIKTVGGINELYFSDGTTDTPIATDDIKLATAGDGTVNAAVILKGVILENIDVK